MLECMHGAMVTGREDSVRTRQGAPVWHSGWVGKDATTTSRVYTPMVRLMSLWRASLWAVAGATPALANPVIKVVR